MTPGGALAAIRAADHELQQRGPTPFPLPIGELAPVVAGAVAALDPRDWWVPSMRERVGAVVRGVPLDRLVHGRHGARPFRVAPPSPAPALRALVAVGLALSEPGTWALVHLGVGSASDGALTEALNLAALHRANVIFVVSVHPLTHAPLGRQIATSPSALAKAYGIPATVVGDDADAVYAAVTAARAGSGPYLIEFVPSSASGPAEEVSS